MRVIKKKVDCHPDYDFDVNCSSIVRHKYKFPTEIYSDGIFYKIISLTNQDVLVSATIKSQGAYKHLEISVDSDTIGEEEELTLADKISVRLGASQDPTNFYQMAHNDPFLDTLVAKYRGLHIPQSISIYESLIQSIIGQQISVHVANMLRELIIETYGTKYESSGITLYSFPSAVKLANVTVPELQQNKFSRRKAEYITDISRLQANGEISLEELKYESNERANEILIALRGVGPWTINWLLMGSLGYNDAFPAGDLALQKAMTKVPNGPTIISSAESLEFSERWRPFRSWATAYIFEAIRNGHL